MDTELTRSAQIVRLLRADEPEEREAGARALVDRWAGPLLGYLEHSLEMDSADASDVLNEVLYRAVLRIQQLQNEAHLSSWLYRIAYYAAADWRRRERRRREIVTEPEQIERHAGSFDPWLERPSSTTAAEERIQYALALLSVRDRQVLSAIAHDLSNEEIAAQLGVSTGNARVLRHRAVARLERAYQQVSVEHELATTDTGDQS